MCPYRNTKALCCPTEYFLAYEADQNRPLISETAGVINCVFIFRGDREHGTKFSAHEDLGARPITRGQRRANQGTTVQNYDMMKCVYAVHTTTTLLPFCVCLDNVILNYAVYTTRNSV